MRLLSNFFVCLSEKCTLTWQKTHCIETEFSVSSSALWNIYWIFLLEKLTFIVCSSKQCTSNVIYCTFSSEHSLWSSDFFFNKEKCTFMHSCQLKLSDIYHVFLCRQKMHCDDIYQRYWMFSMRKKWALLTLSFLSVKAHSKTYIERFFQKKSLTLFWQKNALSTFGIHEVFSWGKMHKCTLKLLFITFIILSENTLSVTFIAHFGRGKMRFINSLLSAKCTQTCTIFVTKINL